MRYEPSGGFVLRSPLLPGSVLAELGGDGDASLKSWARDPVMREAIFLASPSLEERLDRWLDGDDPDGDDTARAVLAYVVRASTRCTPFGLFATVAAGETHPANPSSTVLSLEGDIARRTRLDFDALCRVVSAAEADDAARDGLRWAPNSSLYLAGGRLRMAETSDSPAGRRYHRVTFELDEALIHTLASARTSGGAHLAELAAALGDDDVTGDEAHAYVHDLVDAQVLVSTLGPCVTGDDPGGDLARSLLAHPSTSAMGAALTDIDEALGKLDAAGPGTAPHRYRELAERLRPHVNGVEIGRLFQVDAARTGDIRLAPAVTDELSRAVELLSTTARPGGDAPLRRWCAAFRERYEDRLVPLAEALDEEVGVPYSGPAGLAAEGAPLLAGLVGGTARAEGVEWTAADAARLDLLTRGERAIELTAADVQRVAAASADLPDAVAVMASLAGESASAIDAGRFRLVVHGIAGPSGARLLGRFAHDPGVRHVVDRHLRAEEATRPDAAWAEVVHLPEGRTGNVLCRPVLREYEIPLLGRSGAPRANQLDLEDLLVTVTGDRPVLWSRRLDREVLARLSTAHNTLRSALAPYRFLTDLQGDGRAQGVRWEWGPLASAPFLPRITHGRLVLSRAMWHITAARAQSIRDEPARACDALRRDLELPRWCAVAVADHELVLDLDQRWAVTLLAHECRRGGVRLIEMLPTPDEWCGSPFANEIVVPMIRTGAGGGGRTPSPRAEGATMARAAPRPPQPEERDFAPGSEWLTARLVAGPASADHVLRDVVAPLVESLTRDGAIDGWFYLRYADPHLHLRVRFHGQPDALTVAVLPALHAACSQSLAQGTLARLQLDTYRREVRRYGGPAGMALTERLWHADSVDALAMLALADDDSDPAEQRWRMALTGVDALLQELGWDLATRRKLVRIWRDGLASQLDAGAALRRHAGLLFRRERGDLTERLAAAGPARAEVAALLDEARALERDGELTAPLAELAASWCHLHVNRRLRAAHRAQELVLYDLLDRCYSAQLARLAP